MSTVFFKNSRFLPLLSFFFPSSLLPSLHPPTLPFSLPSSLPFFLPGAFSALTVGLAPGGEPHFHTPPLLLPRATVSPRQLLYASGPLVFTPGAPPRGCPLITPGTSVRKSHGTKIVRESSWQVTLQATNRQDAVFSFYFVSLTIFFFFLFLILPPHYYPCVIISSFSVTSFCRQSGDI